MVILETQWEQHPVETLRRNFKPSANLCEVILMAYIRELSWIPKVKRISKLLPSLEM